MEFSYKTQPFDHQRSVFEQTWEESHWGLLFEQRCGKSKVALDTAAQLYAHGRINALFVLAPNGVQRNWAHEEIPTHLPDWVPRYIAIWGADGTKKKQLELDKLFDRGPQLRILCMNIEAIGTKKGFEFAKKFLENTDCLWAADETTRLKNPETVTVKNVLKLRDKAKYRRILNGTPITQGPLDMFSQLLFLNDDAVPVQSYVAFKARYADFLPQTHPLVQSIMKKTGKRWVPPIIATNPDGTPRYKNLEELKTWVDKCCTRVLRKDCADMPDKMYKRWEVVLPLCHQEILNKYLLMIKKGHTPEPIEKMTAVMFYQRMLCGLVPYQLRDEGIDLKIWENPKDNPRIKAIEEIIEEYPEAPMIIWARFRSDLNEIADFIEARFKTTVARYWGGISPDKREDSKVGFQTGKYQYFVGQQQAGGVGLPLHRAEVMVYHSNTFSLYDRAQSEDRGEHLLKDKGTLIIDLETPGTVDTKIITALRAKKDVSELITGDPTTNWLE